jgi:hypothetical protein
MHVEKKIWRKIVIDTIRIDVVIPRASSSV